jgi:hypothetical protein
LKRAFAALALLASVSAAAADVTCSGSLTEGAVNLACTGAGGPLPPPPPPPPPVVTPTTPSGCSAPAYSVAYEYNGKPYRWAVGSGQAATFRMPVLTAGNRHAEMLVFQTTNTPSDLLVDVAIADCPGKFDVDALCKQTGVSAWTVDIHGFTAPSVYTASNCGLQAGKTYYFNVRHVNCPGVVCELGTQYVGDMK